MDFPELGPWLGWKINRFASVKLELKNWKRTLGIVLLGQEWKKKWELSFFQVGNKNPQDFR